MGVTALSAMPVSTLHTSSCQKAVAVAPTMAHTPMSTQPLASSRIREREPSAR
mgnify:CR=1 FL=1